MSARRLMLAVTVTLFAAAFNPSGRAAARDGSPAGASAAYASREAFGARVANLAAQSDQVDLVWTRFRSACKFTQERPHGDARGWLALWVGAIRVELPAGFCRELFNQIVELGEPVNAGMTAAEDVARRNLPAEDIREIRRRYRMESDGWGRTPPRRVEQ